MRFFKIFFVLYLATISAQAQTNPQVFDLKKLTWYGVDCSHLKCIGDYSHWGDRNRLREIYMPAWNNVILNEPEKFNLSYFFNDSDIEVNIQVVSQLNAAVFTDSLVEHSRRSKYLSETQILQHIKSYYRSNKKGWGVVMMPENFDGFTKHAIIDLVIFDIESGEVALMKRLNGRGGGVGLKNYWVNTVHTCLNSIRKSWKVWKHEAKSKNG